MWRRITNACRQAISPQRKTPQPPQPEGWCPLCGKLRSPACLACKGARSQPALDENIAALSKRRAFADSEVMAIIDHIRYASPAVQHKFRVLIRQILADELATGGHGHAVANLALGIAAGNTIGDIIEP